MAVSDGQETNPMDKFYASIDLKSFYASVECRERGLDPLDANLVVADESRSEKTICLAVSPSMKKLGLPGRPRLFEVIQKVREINNRRKYNTKGHALAGKSTSSRELEEKPSLAVSYITAVPRMALYMKYSTTIYQIYLKYIAPEDIHVYSIDEVFLDLTPYLAVYRVTPRELVRRMIADVLDVTGITATAGIGTNLYLAKIAMDIVAKHIPADEDGVRIAELDEMSYRRQLWAHEPITDFWRVGKGYAKKLLRHGIRTMGDIARCSLGKPGDFYHEDLLYRLFGVNAELLIDHAWGYEPCTIEDIKKYRPENKSIGSGQVLQSPYPHEKARLIVWEMTDLLVLDLVEKGLQTDQVVLTVGYDAENMKKGTKIRYQGEVTLDHYGRTVPKSAHGTQNLEEYTSSTKRILDAMMRLFDRIVDPSLLVRRVNVVANHVLSEHETPKKEESGQMDLFIDYDVKEAEKKEEEQRMTKEKAMQKAILFIKNKFGKNAILKAANLQEGAMTIERNRQVGGHKA